MLPPFRVYYANSLCSLLISIAVIVFPTSTLALECPPPPSTVSKDIRVETEGQLAAISKLKGAELRNRTEVIAKNLIEKTPNSDRVYASQLLASLFCGMINEAKSLTDKEKFTEFKEFQLRLQRLILGSEKSSHMNRLSTEETSLSAVLQPRSKLLQESELRRRGLIPTYGTNDDGDWIVALYVTSKFSQSRFNRDSAALHSIETIDFSHSQLGNQNIALELNETNQLNKSAAPLISWASLRFDSRPKSGSKLFLRIAGQTTEVVLDQLRWTRFQYERGVPSKSFPVAQADLSINFREPEWPLIRKVRLFGTMGEGTSLLEISLENHSDMPLTIENVYLLANHPRGELGTSCFMGDHAQTVFFAWDSAFYAGDGKSWTELGSEKVPIQAEYKSAGICSNYSLRALIPVSKSIDGHSSGKVLFRVLEMPPSNTAARQSAELPSLTSDLRDLNNWRQVSVALNATTGSQPVFPRVFRVERQKQSLDESLDQSFLED